MNKINAAHGTRHKFIRALFVDELHTPTTTAPFEAKR
jgi:hypothetical protein